MSEDLSYIHQLEKDMMLLATALEQGVRVKASTVRNVVEGLKMPPEQTKDHYETLSGQLKRVTVEGLMKGILNDAQRVLDSPVFKKIVAESPEAVGMNESERSEISKNIAGMLGVRKVRPRSVYSI